MDMAEEKRNEEDKVCYISKIKEGIVSINYHEITSDPSKNLQDFSMMRSRRLSTSEPIDPGIIYFIVKAKNATHIRTKNGNIELVKLTKRGIKKKTDCLDKCPFGKKKPKIIVRAESEECPLLEIACKKSKLYKIPEVGVSGKANCICFPNYSERSNHLDNKPRFFHYENPPKSWPPKE